MGTSSKEAVVFILDAFPTMTDPYPGKIKIKREPGLDEEDDNGKEEEEVLSRFRAAQQAIESMIFDMMLNAKSGSLASVIVTKTRKTRHHLKKLIGDPNDSIFPNLTEVCYDEIKRDGRPMRPPSAKMVREMWAAQPDASIHKATLKMQGDICDALILAADALFQCTTNKDKKPLKFDRKIVMLTDAGHPIVLDVPQLMTIIDSLREMNCQVHVLGMGFELPTVEYATPLDASRAIKQEEEYHRSKRVKRENMWDESQPDAVRSEEEDPNVVYYEDIEDRERLLASIAEKTGGSVASIASMQELLDAKAGKQQRKAAQSKFLLHVGPGLTVNVKKIVLMSSATPRMKHQILGTEDENGVCEEVKRVSDYFRKRGDYDEDGEEDEDDSRSGKSYYTNVLKEDQARAVRYGKTLIPLGDVEREGMKAFKLSYGYEDDTFDQTVPHVHILGYANRSSVHQRYLRGNPCLFFGANSKRACTVLAALAQSLYKTNFVALSVYKATKASKPRLAALYPFEEDGQNLPTRLMLFQLPYDEDVKHLVFPSFSEILEGDEDETPAERKQRARNQQASDNLVDSMMLDDYMLRPEKISSPFHTAFYKTILQRSVRGQDAGLVKVRGDPLDKMVVPPSFVENARPALEKFRRAFPLKKKREQKVVKGEKKPTYTDYL